VPAPRAGPKYPSHGLCALGALYWYTPPSWSEIRVAVACVTPDLHANHWVPIHIHALFDPAPPMECRETDVAASAHLDLQSLDLWIMSSERFLRVAAARGRGLSTLWHRLGAGFWIQSLDPGMQVHGIV
jgi:hypothetical protein